MTRRPGRARTWYAQNLNPEDRRAMPKTWSAGPNPALSMRQGAPTNPATLVPELLTPEQVAELLHVEASLLRRWRYERRGPMSFKIGKYVRYRLEDVIAWLDDQRDASGQGRRS
jgi:predicted DNA-binding transcriptional regulator AlpA